MITISWRHCAQVRRWTQGIGGMIYFIPMHFIPFLSAVGIVQAPMAGVSTPALAGGVECGGAAVDQRGEGGCGGGAADDCGSESGDGSPVQRKLVLSSPAGCGCGAGTGVGGAGAWG